VLIAATSDGMDDTTKVLMLQARRYLPGKESSI